MRIDIPQDLPQRRETSPRSGMPVSQEPTPVQRHLHSVKERAAQTQPRQAPVRRAASRSPRREPEPSPIKSASGAATKPDVPVSSNAAHA